MCPNQLEKVLGSEFNCKAAWLKLRTQSRIGRSRIGIREKIGPLKRKNEKWHTLAEPPAPGKASTKTGVIGRAALCCQAT